MTTAVEFKNVDIVFGERAAEGLKLLDQGASRSEILEKTGARNDVELALLARGTPVD